MYLIQTLFVLRIFQSIKGMWNIIIMLYELHRETEWLVFINENMSYNILEKCLEKLNMAKEQRNEVQISFGGWSIEKHWLFPFDLALDILWAPWCKAV